MRSIFARSLAVLTITLVGFVALQRSGTDLIQASQQASAEENISQDMTLPGSAGMRVSLDPETGQFGMPTAAQNKLLEQQALQGNLQEILSRSTTGLHEEVLPDGTVKVHLQGRFQSASVAVIHADGTVSTSCVDSPEAAEHFVETAPLQRLEVK